MKGTAAQVKFAEDVKAKWLEVANGASHEVITAFFSNDDAAFWCGTCPRFYEYVKDAPAYRVFQVKQLVSYVEDSIFGHKAAPTPHYNAVTEMKARGAEKAEIKALDEAAENLFEAVRAALIASAKDVKQEAPQGIC